MSRPIKFRAWDKHEKRMLYRGIFDRNWYATPANDEGGCHCVREITPNDAPRLDLMQFTGLTDKHGKEIYEGDWLSWDEDVYEVRYLRGEWVLFHTSDDDYDRPSLASIIKPSGDNVEILGNIYEHPHLLVNPTSATGGG